MKSGIYKIENKLNGKFYIGKSTNILKRFDRHKRELNKGIHHCIYLQRAWIKYGEENFSFEILIECGIDEATSLEQHYLDNFNPFLYNVSRCSTGGDLTSYHPNKEEIIQKRIKSQKRFNSSLSQDERNKLYGRQGEENGMYGKSRTENVKEAVRKHALGNQYSKGLKRSEEQRKLLSELASQRTGEKNPFYGKSHSEESKQKMREKLKGKKPVNAQKVKVDETIYESASQASKALGVVVATILNRVKSDKFPNYTKI